MCMIWIEDFPPQFDALLSRLHPQLMLIFATIVLDLSKSALGSFRPLQESSPCVLSSDFSSLAYWNFRLIVLKHNVINSLGYPKNRIISVGDRPARRSSIIRLFDYILCLVSMPRPFWVYDYLLEASGLLNRQQWHLTEAQYGGKF